MTLNPHPPHYVTGLHMLRGLIREGKEKKVQFLLAHVKEPVFKRLKVDGFFDGAKPTIKRDHIFNHVSDAVTLVMGERNLGRRGTLKVQGGAG